MDREKAKSKLLELFIGLMPLIAFNGITLLIFRDAFLFVWLMHRAYMFLWAIIPIMMLMNCKSAAPLLSCSFIGSAVISQIIGRIVNCFANPIDAAHSNSNYVLTWFICTCVLIPAAFIARAVLRRKRKKAL